MPVEKSMQSSPVFPEIAEIVSRVANENYGNSRGIMPDQPWWDNLESSFHKFPDDFELDLRTQLMVDATVAGDLALRTGVASVLATLAMPMSVLPHRMMQDLSDMPYYEDLASSGDPALFFARPPSDVPVRSRKAAWYHFHPEDGTSELLEFDSPFVPGNPRVAKSYLRHRRNRVARAQYWAHKDGPRPTLCLIHGFMADPYWLNSVFLALPWFYKQGYDVLLYTLPFHGARQGTLSPFSGHGYFAHGFSHMNETVAQSIYDFRIFLDWLEARGAYKVGVTGISLGGYTTALLAAVEDRLHFAIPNVPVISLVDLILQWWPASTMVKLGLRAAGIPVRQARHFLAVHCPLTWQPRIPRERLMIVAGAGDRLAPPKHARLLWEHWGRCAIHWFPGNHIVHLDQGKYLHEMLAFM